MIQNYLSKVESQSWQEVLQDLVVNPKEIADILQLDTSWCKEVQAAISDFPMRIPRQTLYYLQTLKNPQPLLRQLLAMPAEAVFDSNYSNDPVGEHAKAQLPGLIQKYEGRVLLTLTQACAVHCRYCFRRDFPYADNNPGRIGWLKVFAQIANDQSIHEVILSGGDPLSLDDNYLAWFFTHLAKISHVKIIRLHTRLPVFVWQRITNKLLSMLASCKQQIIIVWHINHADEISPEFMHVSRLLHAQGIIVLNQAVLLKDVNDNASALMNLSKKLVSTNIIPYYLHMLDKVQGAAHFAVDENRAVELMRKIKNQLPGYMVPKLVCELADGKAKTAINCE